ncbi:MAG: ComF family protein [Syntrophales bacterium]|nr:ComF family protein [Syntrophales bacterium]
MGILEGIADILFPPRCLACSKVMHDNEPISFCHSCKSQFKTISSPLCFACGLPFETTGGADHLCGDCIISPKTFSVARSLGRYETTLLESIHAFKYKGKSALGKVLGQIMAAHSYPGFQITEYTVIIPVPLHTRRLRERRFNQALILARTIARKYAVPLDFTSLTRHVYTQPQIALGKKERLANVRGAFRVDDPDKIRGEKILLIDDVYTTGSTLNECARILIKSGAAEVGVLTLARAV